MPLGGGGVEETGSFSGGVVRSVARLSFDTRTIVRLDSSRIEVAVHLPAHAEVAAGDRITFAGAVVKPPTAANPGAFCYRSYLKRLGVCGLCYPEKFALQPGGGIGLLGAIRNKMRSNLTSQLRAPGLALALVLGERDGLGAEQQERWRQLGISHLLAISGMHVAFRPRVRVRCAQAAPARLGQIMPDPVDYAGLCSGCGQQRQRLAGFFCSLCWAVRPPIENYTWMASIYGL